MANNTESSVINVAELPFILTTENMMKLTGLSRPTLYNLLAEAQATGIFPVRKAGHKWLISRDGFIAWLNGQQTSELNTALS